MVKYYQFLQEKHLRKILPFKIGIKTFAAKMAKIFGIKLVFYGEHYSDYGSGCILSYRLVN